jgi:tripartite-type tricarboxylate transporter receptor subunit TctC
MRLPRRRFLQLAAGAIALPVSRIARAQSYPAKPVRVIVGFAPGGGNDIAARLISHWLSQRLGQQFIVENRPGAGSNIATEAVVRAPPDGYTLLLVAVSNAANATLYDKLNFNFIRDIAPVAGVLRVPNLVEVHPSVPVQTLPEFIAYAKANPGKVNMGSGGSGGPVHMTGELFNMMAGLKMQHVPYRGEAPALNDLIGGQVKKCKISLCNSDQTLPISCRANAGAMRFANVRPTIAYAASYAERNSASDLGSKISHRRFTPIRISGRRIAQLTLNQRVQGSSPCAPS